MLKATHLSFAQPDHGWIKKKRVEIWSLKRYCSASRYSGGGCFSCSCHNCTSYLLPLPTEKDIKCWRYFLNYRMQYPSKFKFDWIFWLVVSGPPPNVQESDASSLTTRITRFTYSQVTTMTNNFQRAIGEGGFGSVYLGFVNGAEQVAVKVLSHSSSQGYRQFKAEAFTHKLNLFNENFHNLTTYIHSGLVFR